METKRLILRPWRETDADSLFKYASNPEIGPAAGWPVHESVDYSLDVIRNIFMQDGVWAVTEKDHDEAIGMISLIRGAKSNFDIPDSEAEISYWIGRPFWGRGYIPEAMQEVVRFGFEELELDCIWCGYFDGNEKSKRVQEKCGFLHHHTNPLANFELIDVWRIEHVTCLKKLRE